MPHPTCNHCGKTSHEEQNCFEIIGYPAGWIPRGGGRGRGRGRGSRGGRVTAGRGRGRAAAYATHAATELGRIHTWRAKRLEDHHQYRD